MHRNIEIIINTSELGAGTRGASLGPGAIMTAARGRNSLLFGQFPYVMIPDFNHYLDRPVNSPFAKYLEGYVRVFDGVSKETQRIIKNGRFPLILAGDHSSAAGDIAGIRMAHPQKKLGVIWIDAHADMHSPFTTPSGNMHGMPLAISLADDNKEYQRNQPDFSTVSQWNNLKSLGDLSPKVNPEHLVLIAVRDTEHEEDELIRRHQVVLHPVSAIRTEGVESVLAAVEAQLKECDSIYVSFDVDSMDPELTSFGTGTPVGNGITPEEAEALLTGLARNPKTVCIEFVEVNPCLDNKINTMAETACTLLEAVIEALNTPQD